MQIFAPEDAGMSSKRLSRISPLMESFVEGGQMPGIMTLIQRKNKVVHFGKYGMMDIEAGKPMQEDALFRIYSMTKPIVSVAFMMLYEEGKFNLDDPISKYLPEFSEMHVLSSINKTDSSYTSVPAINEITVKQLFTFSSGLYYGFDIDSLSLIFAKNNI